MKSVNHVIDWRCYVAVAEACRKAGRTNAGDNLGRINEWVGEAVDQIRGSIDEACHK